MNATTPTMTSTTPSMTTDPGGNYSNATTPHPLQVTCNNYITQNADFVNYYTAASVLVIFLFSFRMPRIRVAPNCCWGRPSLVYPVDFLTDPTRREAYSAVLIMFAGRIVRVYNGQSFWLPPDFYDPQHAAKYPYVFVFLIYFFVVQLSVCFYTLMLFIRRRRHIPANILGLLFMVPWVWSTSVYYINFIPCLDVRDNLNVVDAVMTDVPIWLAYVVLAACFIQDLIKNIKLRVKHEKLTYKGEFYARYVRALLQEKESREAVAKNVSCCRYKRISAFRFPLRVMASTIVAVFVLYRIAIMVAIAVVRQYNSYLAGDYGIYIESIAMLMGIESRPEIIHHAVQTFYYSFWVCAAVCLILQVAMIINMVMRYRKHVQRLLRGDRSWMLPDFRNPPPVEVMICNMQFSGYQIAFTSYGFLASLAVMLSLVCLVAFGLVLPLVDDFPSVIVDNLAIAWPTILLAVLIKISQTLLAKLAFLQNKGQIVALNNKKAYHIFEYYMFFFNVILGFIVANRRILYSMIFGALRISRLDRLFLMKGVHRLDEGHKTYMSLVIMEQQHNHPIMRCFIAVAGADAELRRITGEEKGSLQSHRAKLRWWKLYTLIQNPAVLAACKEAKESKEEVEMNLIKNGSVIVDTETWAFSNKVDLADEDDGYPKVTHL